MKNFFLVFLQCAEARKTSFWPFCSVQQREKLLFGLFAVCKSQKNSFLAVFTPAALKAAGNKPNESNPINYSETGRADNPQDRVVTRSGYT